MAEIIKTQNLSVVYNLGKSNEFAALRKIDIEIHSGEYIIFFGPSGCGKSTLLYCLAGLENATAGGVFIRGNLLSGLSRRALVDLRRSQIGMIFQAYNLVPTLTVLDNVLLPNILSGGAISETSVKKARDMFERFGIAGLERRYPRDLSGGQQQRVAITRALMSWPPIMYADEPTGNLDSESADVVMQFLSDLNRIDGKTVVLVTHDPANLYYAHRVVYMKNGQVTKITANAEKKQIAPAGENVISTGIETLSRIYPYLSDVQIKAKALAQYVLGAIDESELERLEQFIQKRIVGELDNEQFREALDRSHEEGGAGFYRPTAAKFSQKIETILNESWFVQKEALFAKPPRTELDIKVDDLRKYLLDGANVQFKKEEELQRMNYLIAQRFLKKIDRKRLERSLDLPFKQGGLGLSRKTARDLAQKLEVALINYQQ